MDQNKIVRISVYTTLSFKALKLFQEKLEKDENVKCKEEYRCPF